MTNRKFANMRKYIKQGQSIASKLMKELVEKSNIEDAAPYQTKNKDDVISSYGKLAAGQIKWLELELAIIKEETKNNDTEEDILAPLTEDEWDIIRNINK